MAKVYQEAQRDISVFADYFLAHLLKFKTPDFHREIYSLARSERRLAIAAPRSFAKSTTIDVIYGLWLLLYGQNVDILIISNSGALSDEWVRKIKLELETNTDLIAIFGDQRNEVKWTQDHIILKNGNQLRAKGRGYQIRGFRPTHIFCDDLEDDEMVRSKDQRDKLREWFLGALLNTLEPNQQFIYIGTLLHPLSLLKQIITDDEPSFATWTKKLYKAIQPDGESIWPEKWSVDQLRAREREIGPHKFEAEYMNNPIADATVIFHPDTYKYYDTIEEKLETVITGFDLIAAVKEFESKDYIAFVTLGKSESGKIYCLDARQGHWTQDEVAYQFVDIWKLFKPRAFVGEEVAFQQQMHEFLIRKVRDELKTYLPIQGIKLGQYTDKETGKKARDKVSRALTVQHIFTQGLFYLKRTQRDLYEQLATFPASDYDDIVDSLVHALHVLTERVKLQVSTPSVNLPGRTPLSTILPKNRFARDGIILPSDGGAL